MVSFKGCLVTGQVSFLHEKSQFSMFSLSYVIPVETVTGSLMSCKEMGQRKWEGISISSINKNKSEEGEEVLF